MKKAIQLFSIFCLTTLIFSGCDCNQTTEEPITKKNSLHDLHETILIDIDGNAYQIKQFNDYIWMTENLKVTKGINGESIKFFAPNNDSNNIIKYGLLYDYETACKVCPEDWHLPTYDEWLRLIEFVGKYSGDKMKDSLYWRNRNQNFTNESGFSARAAGYGNTEFENYFGANAIFWSSTKVDSHFVLGFALADKSDTVRWAAQHPTYAFSVRCIKNNYK